MSSILKYSLTINLMNVQKIIIFTETLLEEDIDYNLFSKKIINDIEFIDSSLNIIYGEFIKNVKYYSNDNLIKIYYSCIKRFYKMLGRVSKNEDLLNSNLNFIHILKSVKRSLEKRLEYVRNFNYRIANKDSDKQCINEEEYSILLKSLE
ncbi:MAG TPA: hypothetical protein PK385_04725 [Spirochaetota bacterium]|nr:MAG: hypothetical protein BWX91_01159 [Spirochaetes bacterium ADurb.Bin133]HNZ27214.1 hypothetical protein [Spirochaetota bacterium]HOF01103.1 hypothetical protein [Spirochaetota bacterium]HOS33968.1 hypothetical protein [Spirochaetota bacterium]HOS55343.1 hypothetical protein [Spirochaetota bacterium]